MHLEGQDMNELGSLLEAWIFDKGREDRRSAGKPLPIYMDAMMRPIHHSNRRSAA